MNTENQEKYLARARGKEETPDWQHPSYRVFRRYETARIMEGKLTAQIIRLDQYT